MNGIVIWTSEDNGIVYTVLCYYDMVIFVGLSSCSQCEWHLLAIWHPGLGCVTQCKDLENSGDVPFKCVECERGPSCLGGNTVKGGWRASMWSLAERIYDLSLELEVACIQVSHF